MTDSLLASALSVSGARVAAQSPRILLSSSLTYRVPCSPFDTFLYRALSFSLPILSLSQLFPASFSFFHSLLSLALYSSLSLFLPVLAFPFAFIFASQSFLCPPFPLLTLSIFFRFLQPSLSALFLLLLLFLYSLFLFTPTATGHSAEITATGAIGAGFFNPR